MALLNEINVKGVSHPIVTDDGYYQGMTVGDAEQLVATTFAEDQVPYTFRTSGGSIDIGDREYDEIVGGTICWNQLGKRPIANTLNGITISAGTNEQEFIVDGTATGNCYNQLLNSLKSITGHVYFASKGKAREGIWLYNDSQGVNTVNAEAIIGKAVADTFFYITVRKDAVFDNEKFMVQLFDLTAMFGPTIADYIYSLEQATEGAGVEWFRKLFPKPYYAYNAGELLSVEGVSSHDMTGFNQWDEEWESGTIGSTTGAPAADANKVRSTNYIPIDGGATYYVKAPANVTAYWYRSDKSFIGYTPIAKDITFVANAEASYMRFVMGSSGSPVTSITAGTFCINLHWDGERDGEYEPYKKWSYPLDDSLTLRGIPKLDASNNLYYDGDTYEADGTVTRRYAEVDLGTLNWMFFSADSTFPYGYFRASVSGKALTRYNILCEKYPTCQNSSLEQVDKQCLGSVNGNYIYIVDSNYSDTAAFTTAMSGLYCVYDLATPTTETADAFQSPQIVDDWGTEEYVDGLYEAGTRDVSIPVGHVTRYQPNLRAKLEMAPNSPDGNGDYIVRQTNGINEYAQLVIPQELPDLPTEDGTYTLKCTVASGVATLSFESEV